MNEDEYKASSRLFRFRYWHLLIFVIVISLLLWRAVVYFAQDEKYGKLHIELLKRDPIVESNAAFQRGDHRPMGCNSEGIDLPGIFNPAIVGAETVNAIIMPHTSDEIEGPTHQRYIKAAYDFARRYNSNLVSRIGAWKGTGGARK